MTVPVLRDGRMVVVVPSVSEDEVLLKWRAVRALTRIG
jgi:hypothetical protein